MAGHFEWVPADASADRRLVDLVGSLRGGDPLAPVWVAVRSPVAGLHLRRVFAAEGPFAALTFSPLSRLAELLGAPAASDGGRQALTDAVLRAACRMELAELRDRRPSSWLAPVADHGATESALAATWRMTRRLAPGTMSRLAQIPGRTAEVAALAEAVSRRLAPHFFDGEELMERAAGVVELGAVELGEIGPVVVFDPDPMPPRTLQFLGALGRRIGVTVVARLCGDDLADRAVLNMGRRLAELGFDVGNPPTGAATTGKLTLTSVPDDDEEVRHAVRLLVGHAEAGGDLGRCVVTFPHDVSDASLADRISAQLRGAGVPHSGAGSTLASLPEGRAYLGLVALASDGEESPALDRGAIMAWLRSGAVRADRGLARGLGHLLVSDGGTQVGAADRPATEGGSGVLSSGADEEAPHGTAPPPVGLGRLAVGRMDRCSRAAGVVGGIEQWRARLSSYARRSVERFEPGAPGPAASDLQSFVERLYALLNAARKAATWTELAAWARGSLEEILVPSELRDALAEATDELAALDRVEPLAATEPRQRCELLHGALEMVLARPAGRGGRFGTGPVVASMHAVAGVSAEMTIVLGCREGTLPVRPSDDPLLPAPALEHAGAGADLDRPDERDRRDLLAVLAASDAVVLTWPRVDLSIGREVLPSRWLEAPPILVAPGSVASFARGLAAVASGKTAAADVFDFELATLSVAGVDRLGRQGRQGRQGREAHYLLELSDLSDRLQAESARHRPGLTRFAGDLRAVGGSEPDMAGVFSGALSPTTLENFALCPFRHFLSHVVRVSPLEAPDEVVSIEARERGSLIHDVLEHYYMPDSTTGAPGMPPSFGDAEASRLRGLVEAAFERAEAEGKTGKQLFWKVEREKIRRDLERFVAMEAERSRASGATPVAVELSFGRGEEAPLVIRAASREVSFRGQMDRVDVEPDGSVVVIDYKSGGSDSYRDIEKDALGRGRHLQLPIYAKAAAERFPPSAPVTGAGQVQSAVNPGSTRPGPRLRAEYRFVSSEASFGVVRVELTEALDSALSDVLGVLVSTIEKGCFPPNPGQLRLNGYDHCTWCDYNSLCSNDRAELWARAREDGALESFVALVEGEGATE
jgi:ATP-dependent helicase/nuclease subunit B